MNVFAEETEFEVVDGPVEETARGVVTLVGKTGLNPVCELLSNGLARSWSTVDFGGSNLGCAALD